MIATSLQDGGAAQNELWNYQLPGAERNGCSRMARTASNWETVLVSFSLLFLSESRWMIQLFSAASFSLTDECLGQLFSFRFLALFFIFSSRVQPNRPYFDTRFLIWTFYFRCLTGLFLRVSIGVSDHFSFLVYRPRSFYFISIARSLIFDVSFFFFFG